MSLLLSTRTELIKTKRSASFWLSLIGAAVIPGIMFLMYMLNAEKNYERYRAGGWSRHFAEGSQVFAAFLLPMFVVLICSLIPQIEYKNNTWKQVFASPQSIGNIFFSKYLSIILMIVLLFVLFDIFMILSAIVPNLFYPQFSFLSSKLEISTLLTLNAKSFISLLGIISIQYWVSLRFKNFIVPIGIGLGLLVASIMVYQWQHIDKVPYAFPFLTFMTSERGDNSIQNHELNSIGYFAFFTLLAFADMRFRKQRG